MRETAVISLIQLRREPPKSLTMTKDTERSGVLAGEAVWSGRWGCSEAPRKGDARLPGAAEEQALCGGQTASPAWAGTAHYYR